MKDNRLISIWGAQSDITDRKRAEEALRDSEERFRKYVSSAPDGIFVTDAQGRYVEVNAAACKMTGYSESELLNMSISELVDPRTVSKNSEGFEKLKATGHLNTETRLRRKDGTIFWASLDAVSISDDRFMAFCTDITEKKEAESGLQRKNVALREVLDQIQADKELVREQMADNLEAAVVPTLARLAETASPTQAKMLDLLNKGIKEIASPFLDTLKHRYASLTPREKELCRLVRGGMASKEIAELLSLSLGTVHKHREQIRRKLGLANEEINLATFLQSL